MKWTCLTKTGNLSSKSKQTTVMHSFFFSSSFGSLHGKFASQPWVHIYINILTEKALLYSFLILWKHVRNISSLNVCRRKYKHMLVFFSLWVEYYFRKYIVFLYKYCKKMKTQLTDFFPFNKYDCKCIKQLHTAQLRSNKNTVTPYRLFS